MARHLGIAVALTVLTFAAYHEVRDHEFVHYDDLVYVDENPGVALGLGWPGVVHAFETAEFANWNPLTLISFQLDQSLHGLDPGGVHVTNLVLHWLASLGLFLAFSRMTRAVWPSAFVAAVFALHPLHVESVAWASERKDVLSGFFFASCLLAYSFYVERTRSPLRYLAVFLALALGLLAKPMLVTLPFVLLLLDYWPLDRLGRAGRWGLPDSARLRRPLVEKLPMLLLVAAISVVTYRVQQADGAVIAADRLGLGARLANAVESYAVYLGQTFWPFHLTPFYTYPDAFPVVRTGGFALLLLGITFGALRAARARPELLVGWLWYLGTLVPVIGLVQVGLQAHADRYMYIPIVGIALAVAFAASAVVRGRAGQRALAAAAASSIVAMAVLSHEQVRVWRSSLALFQYAVALEPDNAGPRGFLAAALLRAGRPDEAKAQYEEMARLVPDSAVPHIGFADLLRRRGDLADAVESYRRGLAIDPRHARAHTDLGLLLVRLERYAEAAPHLERAIELYGAEGRLKPRGATPSFGLGRIADEEGRLDAALRYYTRALSLDPELGAAHHQLGLVLLRRGDLAGARRHLERSLVDYPNSAETHHALAQIADGDGRAADAVRHYRRALEVQPEGFVTANNLAWLLATSPDRGVRRPGEAVTLAESALAAVGDGHPTVLDTLAAAYAADGRFDDAIRTASRARDAALAQGDESAAADIGDRIALYRDGRAYVEAGS